MFDGGRAPSSVPGGQGSTRRCIRAPRPGAAEQDRAHPVERAAASGGPRRRRPPPASCPPGSPTAPPQRRDHRQHRDVHGRGSVLNFTASAQKCVGCQKNPPGRAGRGARTAIPATVAQAMRPARHQTPPHSVPRRAPLEEHGVDDDVVEDRAEGQRRREQMGGRTNTPTDTTPIAVPNVSAAPRRHRCGGRAACPGSAAPPDRYPARPAVQRVRAAGRLCPPSTPTAASSSDGSPWSARNNRDGRDQQQLDDPRLAQVDVRADDRPSPPAGAAASPVSPPARGGW